MISRDNIHLLPVRHSFDVSDTQNDYIEERFNEFIDKNTTPSDRWVIIEGALRGELNSKEEAITPDLSHLVQQIPIL